MANKSTPARPKSVPQEAVWNEQENEWELGQTKNKKSVGEWTWWRPDGSLVCRSHFNDNGQLNGPFERFHPDGTTSRTGSFIHGRIAGLEVYTRSPKATEEFFPAEKPVWQVKFDHGKAGQHESDDPKSKRYFLKNGTECNAKGKPLDQAYQDDLFLESDPSDFLEGGGLKHYLDLTTKKRKNSTLPAGVHDFQALWGMPMPSDLQMWIQLLSEYSEPDLYECRPDSDWKNILWTLPPNQQNTVEHWVSDLKNFYFTMPLNLLTGSLMLGDLYNGDIYLYGLYDRLATGSKNRVWFFDHETSSLEKGAFASDLSTLSYVASLSAAFEDEEMVSKEAFQKSFQKLKGKTNLSWHFSSLLEAAKITSRKAFDLKEEMEQTRYFHYRSEWIRQLLAQEEDFTMNQVKEWFIPSLNEKVTDKLHQEILGNIPKAVPSAMYWLFRHFFFKEDDRLSDCILAAQNSSSRFIRDAASLVEALQNGQKKLGKIKNIHTLREEFLALDLNPNDAGARATKQAATQKKAAAEKKQAIQKVQTWLEQKKDIVELAWEHIEQPDILAEVEKALRAEPTMQQTFEIVDWIENQGYHREGLILDHEKEEAIECLTERGDKRILPILVGKFIKGKHLLFGEILAAWSDDRVLQAIIPCMGRPDNEYHHFKQALLGVFAAYPGGKQILPILLECLDLKKYPLHGGFIQSINHGGLIKAALHALKRHADATAFQAVLDIVTHSSDRYDDYRGAAAEILATIGDASCLPELIDLVKRKKDKTPPEILYAIGMLGENAKKDRSQQAIECLQSISFEKQGLTCFLVAQTALAKCNLASDHFADLLKEQCYVTTDRNDNREEQLIWSLRALGALRGFPSDWILPHVYTDIHSVRHAALDALKSRGIPTPPLRKYYRFVLGDLLKYGGLQALHHALADNQGIFRYNIALRLAEIKDSTSAPHLCTEIRGFLWTWERKNMADPDDTPYEFKWLVQSLIRLGPLSEESALILVDCLRHPDRNVKDPVLREPPKDERLASGMQQVVEENYGWQADTARTWLKNLKKTSNRSKK